MMIMVQQEEGQNEYISSELKKNDKESFESNNGDSLNEDFSNHHPSNDTKSLSTMPSINEFQEDLDDTDTDTDTDTEQEDHMKEKVLQQKLFERSQQQYDRVGDEENQCEQITTILSDDVRPKYSNTTKMKMKNDAGCCVRAECAICLEAYALGDKITWSPLDCNHAFHQECILEWLTTLGEKACRDTSNSDNIMQSRLCKFDMVCPICRKDFIPNASTK